MKEAFGALVALAGGIVIAWIMLDGLYTDSARFRNWWRARMPFRFPHTALSPYYRKRP